MLFVMWICLLVEVLRVQHGVRVEGLDSGAGPLVIEREISVKGVDFLRRENPAGEPRADVQDHRPQVVPDTLEGNSVQTRPAGDAHFLPVPLGQCAPEPSIARRDFEGAEGGGQRFLNLSVGVKRDGAVADQVPFVFTEPRCFENADLGRWQFGTIGRFVISAPSPQTAQLKDSGGNLVENRGPGADHSAAENNRIVH